MAFAGLALLTRLKRSPTIQCNAPLASRDRLVQPPQPLLKNCGQYNTRGARYFLMEQFFKNSFDFHTFYWLGFKI